MQWPNRSTLKSNFSELTLEGWLIRNFFSSELPTYMLIPTKFLLSLIYSIKPPLAAICLKTKKHRQSSDYQCFLSVGVTGFEPATTRPPDFDIYCMIITDYQTFL